MRWRRHLQQRQYADTQWLHGEPEPVGGNGGGIYNSGSTGKLTVSDCMLSANIAFDGGGVYNSNGATATIIKSTLSGNIAQRRRFRGGQRRRNLQQLRHSDLEWLHTVRQFRGLRRRRVHLRLGGQKESRRRS